MTSESLRALLDLLDPYFTAIAVSIARLVALASVLPVFARLGLTGILRNAVVIAIALPMVSQVTSELAVLTPLQPGQILVLVAKEAVIGVLLGLLFGLPFWAVEAAGELIDMQRGVNGAYLLDPNASGEASPVGTLFVLVLLALFFAGNGLGVMAEALYTSYALWPVTELLPPFTGETPTLLLGLLDQVVRLGLLLAAPLVVVMLLADIALAVIGRMAPQLNVFDLSLSVKSAAVLLALPLYAIFLVPYFNDSLASMRGVLDLARTVLP
ncbi:type III secretion system export apparatus subunit SctT [Inquilinus sp. OTU3971]|uniref:type III secretion system export apparatus subunit SctT n=1 Tax=Inquilinus sp. OTU3971 TaxID=3043855 RepID=UPI00313ADE4C